MAWLGGPFWAPFWDPILKRESGGGAAITIDLHHGDVAYVDLPMRASVGSMYEDRCGKE